MLPLYHYYARLFHFRAATNKSLHYRLIYIFFKFTDLLVMSEKRVTCFPEPQTQQKTFHIKNNPLTITETKQTRT